MIFSKDIIRYKHEEHSFHKITSSGVIIFMLVSQYFDGRLHFLNYSYLLLYLSDSTRGVIGQFCGSYFTVLLSFLIP